MEEYEGMRPLDNLLVALREHEWECIADDVSDSLIVIDKDGNPHECWDGGSPDHVNVVVAMTIDDALTFFSNPLQIADAERMFKANVDKNNYIAALYSENAKLRAARDAAVEDAKSIIVMLSNARAENARLRSELESVGVAAYLYGRGDLKAENAKLRDALKALMVGTNAELCSYRDEPDCKECSMHHGKDGCVMINTMEMLGIDMFGEPLEVKS